MTKVFNHYKPELTEDEEQYLAQNNELRLQRERAMESGRMDDIKAAYDDHLGIWEDDEEDGDDVETVSVEDFVASASKADIIEQLKALENPKVTVDTKKNKDELGDQLIAEVKRRQSA
jgi:hypothetical protein